MIARHKAVPFSGCADPTCNALSAENRPASRALACVSPCYVAASAANVMNARLIQDQSAYDQNHAQHGNDGEQCQAREYHEAADSTIGGCPLFLREFKGGCCRLGRMPMAIVPQVQQFAEVLPALRPLWADLVLQVRLSSRMFSAELCFCIRPLRTIFPHVCQPVGHRTS